MLKHTNRFIVEGKLMSGEREREMFNASVSEKNIEQSSNHLNEANNTKKPESRKADRRR